jgi:Uri superfamily endonuclease
MNVRFSLFKVNNIELGLNIFLLERAYFIYTKSDKKSLRERFEKRRAEETRKRKSRVKYFRDFIEEGGEGANSTIPQRVAIRISNLE